MPRPAKSPDTQTISGHVAAEIRRRRLKLKLSVEEAAARAAINAQTWYSYEQGRHLPMKALPAIAGTLKCRPKDLLP